MIIKIFGYYINIFKVNKQTVSPGKLKNNVNETSSAVIEFMVDLQHMDEPVLHKEVKVTGNDLIARTVNPRVN